MSKVSELLPKDGSIYGVWINDEDKNGDVHIYVGKAFGAVLGQNKNYKDKVQESDIALSVKDGKLNLQYHEDGKVIFVELCPDKFKVVYTAFLEGLKSIASNKPTVPVDLN